MKNICECLRDLTIENAEFLYNIFGLVFYINDGELVGISTERGDRK